eukprot:GHUV01035489.1.p1 GENE.GHUV01035489.1~~GHUV01035489.1.p1  ORF type:complete len:120 (-),score=15.27 GHUV01035489.1:239-598(-)
MSHYTWHSLSPAAQALALHTFRLASGEMDGLSVTSQPLLYSGRWDNRLAPARRGVRMAVTPSKPVASAGPAPWWHSALCNECGSWLREFVTPRASAWLPWLQVCGGTSSSNCTMFYITH